MSITIGQESRTRSRLAIDINYSGNRYKTTNRIFTFPAPSLETIDQHLYYLLKNSQEKKFERQYLMRPDYLSFDEYGTVALAQLLMYVNAVSSPEVFELQTVIIPSLSAITEMLKDKFPVQEIENLTEVTW